MWRDHYIFHWWKMRGSPASLVTYHIFILCFLFFHSLSKFYIGEEGKESMMDHLGRGGRFLVALASYWWLHMIVQHVLDMQALALNGEGEKCHDW